MSNTTTTTKQNVCSLSRNRSFVVSARLFSASCTKKKLDNHPTARPSVDFHNHTKCTYRILTFTTTQLHDPVLTFTTTQMHVPKIDFHSHPTARTECRLSQPANCTHRLLTFTEEALLRPLQNQSYLELLILEPLNTQTGEALRGFLRFCRKNAHAQQAIEAVEATSSAASLRKLCNCTSDACVRPG